MRGLFGKYRGLFVALLIFVLPLALLYGQVGANPANPLVRGLHWVTGPVQSAVTLSWQAASSLVNRYLWLVDTAANNTALQQKVAQLKQETAQLQEQAQENQRLHRLLQLQQGLIDTRSVAAKIIAVGQSSDYRTLRINRGRIDGVRRRAGVIAADGVVGRVVSVSRYYADVLLLTDASSRLDIETAHSRARGMLRGAGRNGRIDAMDRTLDIQVGDTVISSGLDGVFPKGLRVGIVRSVHKPSVGLYLEAEVEPFVHFSQLEQVLVLIHAPTDLNWPRIDDRGDDATMPPLPQADKPDDSGEASASPLPKPAPKPQAAPAPKPQAAPAPKPQAAPAPKPQAAPAPKPQAAPAPKPQAAPAPKPQAAPAPKPQAAPAPKPQAAPAPKPQAAPAPKPQAAPAPKPQAAPAPKPQAAPAPKPQAAPAPGAQPPTQP